MFSGSRDKSDTSDKQMLHKVIFSNVLLKARQKNHKGS